MVDEVDLGIQLDELILPECQRCSDPEHHAEQGSYESDHQTLREKYAPHRTGCHPHCLEDADLSRLVRDDHCQVAYNVERRDEDDQQENEPHAELLELERLEERLVLFLPVDGPIWE